MIFGKVKASSLANLSHTQESRKVRRGAGTYIGSKATSRGAGQAANGMAPGTAN